MTALASSRGSQLTRRAPKRREASQRQERPANDVGHPNQRERGPIVLRLESTRQRSRRLEAPTVVDATRPPNDARPIERLGCPANDVLRVLVDHLLRVRLLLRLWAIITLNRYYYR